MAREKTYSEKLKDPRWQKKRLKILERDGWSCVYCADKYNTLHVHHKIYLTGHEPWDYEDHFLMTLCEDCHSYASDGMNDALKQLSTAVRLAGFFPKDIEELARGFERMPINHVIEVVASIIAKTCSESSLQDKAIDNYFEFLMNKRNG